MARGKREGESTTASVEVRDYNGPGRWSREQIVARYHGYCRLWQSRVELTDLTPLIHTEGSVTWVYPVMHRVIYGIEASDRACIALGVDFVEEDLRFPFGKILKSNTARALRRALLRGDLSKDQAQRLRKRIVSMLVAGVVPHEFKEYAKLLRHLGVGALWAEIEEGINRENRYVMRYYRYLRQAEPLLDKQVRRKTAAPRRGSSPRS